MVATRAAAWASGVEVGVVAEELGRGVADTPFLGPTLATELRRAAGAPAPPTTETVLLTADLAAVATTVRRDRARGILAVDTAGSSTALLLTPADGGWSLASDRHRDREHASI